jgi:hypothetical protein|tara:strand:+ start:88 stop:294 length:207 start_codon:yes stop_codon:yes gene_type:complete
VLQKYSKKRQNDLTSFAGLILYVIYLSHIMACVWLLIGALDDCRIDVSIPYGVDTCSEEGDEITCTNI